MNVFLILALTVGLAFGTGFARAQEAVAPVEVGNKICPVSNEKIGTEGMEAHKVTHNGKVYNLCCAMCAQDFDKDPEKYTKLVEEELKSETQTQ